MDSIIREGDIGFLLIYFAISLLTNIFTSNGFFVSSNQMEVTFPSNSSKLLYETSYLRLNNFNART